MSTQGSKTGRASDKKDRGVRSAAGFIAVALVVGTVMLMLDLYEDLPDLYDPARVALSRAETHLDRSYDHEEDVLHAARAARQELDEAVDLLQSAAQADPLIKGQIDAIRGRLEALKKEQPSPATTPQELHRAYRELLTDINNLLKRKR